LALIQEIHEVKQVLGNGGILPQGKQCGVSRAVAIMTRHDSADASLADVCRSDGRAGTEHGEHVMSEPTDRRAAERLAASPEASCSFLSPVVEDFGPAKIKNISAEGIGLLMSRRVETGTLLAVTLSNPTRGLNKTVLVRVAHVTGQPGSWLVGGTFNSPLTYQELTTLVM
jgi:hypothetical protein